MDPHSQSLKMVFGILGNIIGVTVGLSPMATFWNIYKKKDTEGFSGLPYVVSLVAALIWTLYGLPNVTQHATLVITINAATSVLQIFYLTIFLSYAPKKPKMKIITILAACLMWYATLAILTLKKVPQEKRSLTVGSMGVVIGAISYASPLSVAKMVICTRSSEFLPILLCVSMFINSTVWTCYGIITRDIFLLLPNGLGVVFGVALLSLYLRYRNATPLDDFATKGKGGDDSVYAVGLDLESGKPNGKPVKANGNVQYSDNESPDKPNGKPVNGNGNVQHSDLESPDKPNGKPVKANGNVQSTALPSQGGI